MIYKLYHNEKITGEVLITSDNLHYIFDVTSSILSLNISRVFMECSNEKISLGILMPKNNTYILQKKIPKSYLKNIVFDDKLMFFTQISGDTPKPKKVLKDKLLESVLSDKITKNEFLDHDTYSFCLENEFLFDFCFTLTHIYSKNGKIFISINTTKDGEIIV